MTASTPSSPRRPGCTATPRPSTSRSASRRCSSLPAEEIERRFNVGPGEGIDIEILGATQGIPGGGFLYTNRETIAIGLVLGLPGSRRAAGGPRS